MENAYAQVAARLDQDAGSNETNVVQRVDVALFRTNGQPGPSGTTFISLPYASSRHAWRSAFSEWAVAWAAQQDVEAVGGYNVLRIFIDDLDSL